MTRRNRKGTFAERYFVWSVGMISYALMFFWTQERIPFNNCSIVVQWVDSILPSLFVGIVGIYVGYLAVTHRR